MPGCDKHVGGVRWIQWCGFFRPLPVILRRLLLNVAALSAEFPAGGAFGHIGAARLDRSDAVPAWMTYALVGGEAELGE